MLDGINAWIANVMDGVVMLLFEEVDFERKDGKKLIHIALDVLDAVFLPSPNLWGDVIIYRYGSVLVNKLGDFEVETRVIHKDNDVGVPLHDVLFADFHVAENGTCMEQDRNKTHVGKFLVVLDESSPYGSHLIATVETEISLGIVSFQGFHQVRSVQVARCFTNY
jgi:hypothetical protein